MMDFCLLNLDMLFATNLSRHGILLFTVVNVKSVYLYQKKKMDKNVFPKPTAFETNSHVGTQIACSIQKYGTAENSYL